MSNYELNRHKRGDKIKWIITAICIVLLSVMVAGLCMQMFAKDDKYKPSEWFKKTEQTQPEEENKTETAKTSTSVTNKKIARTQLIDPDTATSYSGVTDSDVSSFGLTAVSGSIADAWNAILTVKNNLNSETANSKVKIAAGQGFTPMYSTCLLVSKDNVFDNLSDCPVNNIIVKVDGKEKTSLHSNDNCYLYMLSPGGGSPSSLAAPISSIEVIYNLVRTEVAIPLPDDPVKEGHTFTGWYFGTAAEHGDNCEKYDGRPIYSDTALHAHFQINRYYVTFDSAGGTSVSSQYVDWNTAATLTTPTKDGYAFKGWFLPDGTQYTNQAIKSATTLTAHWERNRFVITFNYENGSESATMNVMLNNSIPVRTPTKEGYNFVGWFMADGNQYTDQPVTDDMTLTARWEIKKFTVTFYVEDTVFTTIEVEYGKQLVKIADEAKVYAQNIVSFEYLNETLSQTEAAKMLVIDDMKVYANKATDIDKVISTVNNNKWAIIGGFAGGIALVAIVAGIIGGVKRKRR